MSTTQTIDYTNTRIETQLIPYKEIHTDFPSTIRVINAAVAIKAFDTDTPNNKSLWKENILGGMSSLKIQVGISLTLFPYRLIPREVYWLWKLLGNKDIQFTCTSAMGIDTQDLMDWFHEKYNPSVAVEIIFRLIVYTELVKMQSSTPDAIDTLLHLNLAPRPLTTRPIVIATPTIYDPHLPDSKQVTLNQGSWSVSITIDPDMDTPISDNVDVTDEPSKSETKPPMPETAAVDSKPEPNEPHVEKVTVSHSKTRKKVAQATPIKTATKVKSAPKAVAKPKVPVTKPIKRPSKKK